jgi:hypothetical protein
MDGFVEVEVAVAVVEIEEVAIGPMHMLFKRSIHMASASKNLNPSY